MSTLVADVEANGLEPTKIWCMVVKDIETKEKKVLLGHNEIYQFWLANKSATWIFHNGIGYDCYYLDRLCGTDFTHSDVVDTLVLSYLYWPAIPGGHSLEAYGERLKIPKVHAWLTDRDFQNVNNISLFIERCETDVEITDRVYANLRVKMATVGFSGKSIELEHQVAWIIARQTRNGWWFHKKAAEEFRERLDKLRLSKEEEIFKLFPPERKLVGTYPIRVKADGNYHASTLKHFQKDHEIIDGNIHVYVRSQFNVGSPPQRLKRLLDLGFTTSKRTKSGGISADEQSIREWLLLQQGNRIGEVCKDIQHYVEPLPELSVEGGIHQIHSGVLEPDTSSFAAVSSIADWLVLAGRSNMVGTWLNKLHPRTHRIHGHVFPCGAATRRATHSGPNTANIPTEASGAAYGRECREFWGVMPDSDRIIMGYDAKSCQMRMFAHHIDNPLVTKLYVEGDPHQANADNAGGSLTRANLKNCYYAFILGAQDPKLGEICGKTGPEGRALGAHIRRTLYRTAPGLEAAIRDAEWEFDKRGGFLQCIDGGFVRPPSKRHVLAYQVQPDEAILMKQAMVYIDERARDLDHLKIGDIHDEGQHEVYFGDAVSLGEIAVQAIRDAGETFNLKAPMDGDFKLGLSWADTH